MTKIITLTPLKKGKFALVDEDDFDYLNQWKWFFSSSGYAGRKTGGRKNQKLIFMHREVIGIKNGMDTDHINGNKLDNRKKNLRICSRSENKMNTRKQSNNTSGYKGVDWRKNCKKWRARIKVMGSQHYLGEFDDLIKAARAYDEAAKKLFGEFANLNFPV